MSSTHTPEKRQEEKNKNYIKYPLEEKYKPTKKGAYKDDGTTNYKP
ncbi:MAG: hypothetical protein WD059_15265 [Balneolaceae bacterium]